MKIHNWTEVDAGCFHDFHNSWATHLKELLNITLPDGYFARSEPHFGRDEGDVVALPDSDPISQPRLPEPTDGTLAIAEKRPQGARIFTLQPNGKTRQRRIAVRTTAGNRVVALIEIISPSNRESRHGVKEFVNKCITAIRSGIHLAILNVFPVGKFDPDGFHTAIAEALQSELFDDDDDESLIDEPLDPIRPIMSSSIVATTRPTIYLSQAAVGDDWPEVALFLSESRYIPLPLAASYERTVNGLDSVARRLLSNG